MSSRRVRVGAAAAAIVAFCAGSATALAGNGYVNMPERGCPTGFNEYLSTAFPGFSLSDINHDGTVCAMQLPGRPGFDVVVDNTSNAP
jgi:hypothetical protein